MLDAGGRAVGEVVTLQTSDGRRVTWCYVTDLEGNIVELQAWSEARAPARIVLALVPWTPGWAIPHCDRWH